MTSFQFCPEVQEFFKNEDILIADPSFSFAKALTETLKEGQVPAHKIRHVSTLDEAVIAIEKIKPKILITEYEIGSSYGLSLISSQMNHYEESVKISALITHDCKPSTIAEAAEGHVDLYLLKPFSIGDFCFRLNKLIRSKLQPSPFVEAINRGKTFLKQKNLLMAHQNFDVAIKINEESALGYYYAGVTSQVQDRLSEAATLYSRGLQKNALHYKCLFGEFDGQFAQGNFKDAYVTAKKISEHFPISSKRMGDLFKSLVYSHNLEDITSYHEMYRALDIIPPELKKIYAAALMTAGKYQLNRREWNKAQECFQMGFSVVGPDISYIKKITFELSKHQNDNTSKDLAKNLIESAVKKFPDLQNDLLLLLKD